MRIPKFLVAGTALCALTLFVAQPASAASGRAGSAATASASASASASVTTVARAASGCSGMTVTAPRPGTAVSAAAMGMPAAAQAFYARAAAGHATWLTDLSCAQTHHVHTLQPAQSVAKPAARNTYLTSSNWSGYQINQTAQYVQGGWTVPTVVKPVPGYSTNGYYSSTWDGIGGGFNAGSGALIQAGTAQQMDSTGATHYYAWYEVVGGTGDTGGERWISLPVHPGDVVGAVSLWTPTIGAEMGVCNFSTTNTCVQFTVASSAPGTSEEWIEEAPYNRGILPLADFQSVTFVNACWAPVYKTGAACLPIAGYNPSSISLQQYVLGGYQILADPGVLNATGNGFTIQYDQPTRQSCC